MVNALRAHVTEFVNDDPSALVFTGAKGGRITSANWQRAVRWPELLRSVGLPVGFHFHDLRHTSNLAAATGASTRELMHRMGHSTMRAALIYQHANSEHDHEIARAIDARINRFRTAPKNSS